jgi:hypothetical protein
MKTTILKTFFTAFVIAFAVSVSAQDFPQEEQEKQLTAEEMAAIQTDEISVELELTPEQTEELSEINLEFFRKKKELKDRKAVDQEFVGIYGTRDESMETVLTQEQFKNWKNPPRGRGNNNGNGNGSNNGGSSDSNSGNGNNGNNKNN